VALGDGAGSTKRKRSGTGSIKRMAHGGMRCSLGGLEPISA